MNTMPRSTPRHQPRRQPKQLRSQDTVEILLQATAKVLCAEGYKKASTNRIASVAGVSIGTLYQYFPSKESLLTELSRRHSERMQKVFAQCVAEIRGLPLREAVRRVVSTELRALQEHMPLLRVLFEHVPRFGPAEHIAQAQAHVAELFRSSLAERRHELRDIDLELAPFLLMHAVDGVLQAALRQRPELVQSEKLLDACTDLVWRYLLPEPALVASPAEPHKRS